ncbi:formylglycine-generating enzyme family protein [Breznakiellaceae bacterium SP9]
MRKRQRVGASIERSVPADLVRIQGGTFTMGSPANEADRWGGESPQHKVTLSAFSMSKTEVTQKDYQALMGSNPSYFKGDKLPVEQVSWYDAIVYCNKKSMAEGLIPAYSINESTNPVDWGSVPTRNNDTWNKVSWNRSANGYRLPTEAEWEYACRAGTVTPFSTGSNIRTSQANYNGNFPYKRNAKGTYRQKTTPVGSFAPNSWGLYDMHGNVWEWCWDWYGAYSSGNQTDPIGAASGSNHVSRGGSWDFGAAILRSAFRGSSRPTDRGNFLGFRIVRP